MSVPAERIISALVCPVCGEALSERRGVFACREEHVRLELAAATEGYASDIIRLVDPERGPRPLVLKIAKEPYRHWHDDPADGKAGNETAVLVALGESLGRGAYRVPEVVPGARGHAILMASAGEESLRERLYGLDAWIRPRGLGSDFRRAGAWLAALSAATEAGERPFDPEDERAHAHELLEKAASLGHDRSDVVRIGRRVDRAAADAQGVELVRCLVHDDFRPDHVYLDRQAVTVIDFEQASEGWSHKDAGFFLAAIEGLARKHPARRYAPGAVSAGRAFVGGYLETAPAGWDRVGPFFRLTGLVRALLIEHQSRLARERPGVFRRIVLPHYRRLFDRLESA